MDRRRDSRTRLIRAVGLCLALTFMVAAPAASADPTAVDEYGLQLPGLHSTDKVDAGPLGETETARDRAAQSGVVGETLDDESPLSTATSLVGGPLVIAIVLICLAWITFVSRPKRTPVIPTR